MKKCLAIIISFLPLSILRVFFYKNFFNYKIRKTTIGLGTIITAKSFVADQAKIGKFCRFLGPMRVHIKTLSRIGDNNIFKSGEWIQEKNGEGAKYKAFLETGRNTLITSGHYFDVAGSFILGDNSWIAGYASQFWTHGAGVVDRDIVIGRNSYIGSAVRFCPGTSIGNNVIVGMGSVVTKKINANNALIAGVPAVVKKENYNWRTKKLKKE